MLSTLLQTPAFQDATLWDKYGLPGLVIGALLASFGTFGWLVLRRNREAAREQLAVLKDVLKASAEERRDQIGRMERQHDEHVEAMRDLHAQTLAACNWQTEVCQALVTEIRLAAKAK